MTPAPDAVSTLVGNYDFGLVRDADTWRINAFRFNLEFLDGNPELERDE